eukprot:g29896.t1
MMSVEGSESVHPNGDLVAPGSASRSCNPHLHDCVKAVQRRQLMSEVPEIGRYDVGVGLGRDRGVLETERGRSPLHVAASRGDLRLCRAMMEADPGLVNQLDHQKNTPLMDAAFLGKNADLMNPLQLACVNEGAGNGDVVTALVEAAADVGAMCWQTTPLMAAADSGHIWALHTLIDMGADPWQMNGSGYTALDYARDMETAEFLYSLMEGDKLSNQAAPRIDTGKLFRDVEARRARLHRSGPQLSLEEAFQVLEAPPEWLSGFRETGEHFNELRKAWRQRCLKCHPDKQPEGLEEEAAAEWTAQFQAAVRAFEVIDQHLRHLES